MRNLIILFTIISCSQIFAQQSRFETNLYLSGSIQNNQSRPRVNKGFSILPDITYRINNKYSIGFGFEYSKLNCKYLEPQFEIIDSAGTPSDYSLQKRYLKSDYYGTRIINRFNRQLNSKLSMIIGFDLGVYRAKESRIDFNELKFKSYDAKVSGIKLQHYVGLKYQTNSRLAFSAYVDLFSISHDKEKLSDGKSSSSTNLLVPFSNGGTSFLKLGISYRF